MILEKLGSLTLLGLAKKAGLLAAAVPAMASLPTAETTAVELAPEPADATTDPDDDDVSAIDRSEIVSSLHDEAIASLDLAAADLAELKNELAGLGERSPSEV